MTYSASFGLAQRRIYGKQNSTLLYRNRFTALLKFQIIVFIRVTVTRETQHGSVRFVNGMHTETYLRMYLMPSCDATVNTYFLE
jgi:hypothetical protein